MPFVKGQSGNPNGRPKVVESIRDLAREHAPNAFDRVLELVKNPDPRVALAASQEVLNRAYGKPSQAFTGENGEGPAEFIQRIEMIAVKAVDGRPG